MTPCAKDRQSHDEIRKTPDDIVKMKDGAIYSKPLNHNGLVDFLLFWDGHWHGCCT